MGKYLDIIRRVEAEHGGYDKNDINDQSSKREGLNSLNTLISPLGVLQNVCGVCMAPGDLWRFGEALVHQECARFLPKPEPAEPTTAYRATSAEPDGTACRVEIIELPATGLRYRRTFAHLQLKPPALFPVARWQRCVEDGKCFLAKWGNQAENLGWTSADLFGLHIPPANPHPSYSRLSRYDCTGLVWLLLSPVVALTADTASIRHPTGNITTYRRYNKPGYGPLGDSLDELM